MLPFWREGSNSGSLRAGGPLTSALRSSPDHPLPPFFRYPPSAPASAAYNLNWQRFCVESGRSQSDVQLENCEGRTRRVLPDGLNASHRGPVTLLRLSRPAKGNALDDATIARIDSFFSNPPEQTRAIILHGEGKHFSAGVDLSAVTDVRAPASVRRSRSWHRAFDRIENGHVPVVAVLHGAVIGGGLELAAAAHIRVAERSAYYALPEASRGIFVGGGGAVRIPRLIGTSRMIDMMLTGRTYSAEEGLSLGFSQYVVDDGHGLAKAIELAERTI
jgi:(methylthio)acryloyl-CoA hydratase